LPSGTILSLTPQVDDSFAIRITVQEKPRLLSLSPASGSIDIYLDSSLEMNFSSSLDIANFDTFNCQYY
jgi:hypothetical protein